MVWTMLKKSFNLLFVFFRISVRAFTQLFDEEDHDLTVASPLFTDTYLSLPMVTGAGEDKTSSDLQQRTKHPHTLR